MIKKRCVTCDKVMYAKRFTRATCSDSCRSNLSQKKSRREEKLVELEKAIALCEADLKKHQNSLGAAKQKATLLEVQVEEMKAKRSEIMRLQALDDKALASEKEYNKIYDLNTLPYAMRPNVLTAIISGILAVGSGFYLPDYLKDIRKKLNLESSSLTLKLWPLNSNLKEEQQKIQIFEKTISQKKKELSRLKEEVRQITEEISFAKKRRQAATPSSPKPNTSPWITAAKLMNMKFDTFSLSGKLGEFMGELERDKLSIALTGDPGAGKTSISLGLAKVFAQAEFKVAYFSLELGIGKVLQDAARRYQVTSEEVSFFDHTDLEDIRKKASIYDVLIVDSLVKLDCKATLIDELRHQFPKTIFVFILQKTSKGTSRGGSSLDYDASIVMDVTCKEGIRQVYMKKSRYGTIGWTYFPEMDMIKRI